MVRRTWIVDVAVVWNNEQALAAHTRHSGDTPHGRAHVKVHMCLRHKTRKDTCKLVHRLPYANSNTSHEKGAIEMKGCRTTRYTCAQASTQVTTMGKRSTESSFSCPPHQLACEPDGAVYSGTLSGTRARLYLNSMVAFSAALSAAPRSKEPAWVGVIAGDWRRGWLPTGMEGPLTCWRLYDRLYWEVGALLRGNGGAPQSLPTRADGRR